MFTRVLHRSSQVKHDDAGGGRGSRSGRRSCPRSPARRLMQMVRYGQPRRHRTPQEADSRQPGDEFDAATEPGGSGRSRACYCCRCAGGGGGGRLTTLVDGCAAMSAADRCRLPRCKWWKSVCTRVYLISVNLASFVSFFPVFHRTALHGLRLLPECTLLGCRFNSFGNLLLVYAAVRCSHLSFTLLCPAPNRRGALSDAFV